MEEPSVLKRRRVEMPVAMSAGGECDTGGGDGLARNNERKKDGGILRASF